MKVRTLDVWRGHAKGVEFECKEARGKELIGDGTCEEVGAEKPKKMKRRKRELEEPSGGIEEEPKSAMTMDNMFGGDKE